MQNNVLARVAALPQMPMAELTAMWEEVFQAKAPKYNPNAHLVTGVVCGVRVEDVEHPLMKQIRQLDKLVDELAKGKAMEKILRG